MTARQAAFKALTAHKKTGVWTDAVLGGILSRENLSERDAALASRLFYGVVQNLSLCDWYIAAFSTVKLYKMQPQILNILRLSVYQLVFLSKIPVNASVNEGVELAKQYANPRAASFVNAVLRKISANLNKLPPVKADTEVERLSILYSHPQWLVQVFCDQLGNEEAEALLKADNEPAAITAMVNTIKSDMPSVLLSLQTENVDATQHPWVDNCLIIKNVHRLDRLEAFRNGWIYIQDPAATMSVAAAGFEPDGFVLDACAAPGGKSFAAGIQKQNKGRILACDIRDKKVNRITDGANRLGLSCIHTRLMDARIPDEDMFGKADAVIADVPCSGLGVIRKKPEIRYKMPEEIEALPKLQLQILRNLANYVKPGGVLLYSTCTLLKCENEGVIEAFLSLNDRFKLEPFHLPEPIGDVQSGMVTLWPHIHGTDGFFICKLRRSE